MVESSHVENYSPKHSNYPSGGKMPDKDAPGKPWKTNLTNRIAIRTKIAKATNGPIGAGGHKPGNDYKDSFMS